MDQAVSTEPLSSLKAGTRQSHERLEQNLDLLGDAMTLARYRHLLTRFQGFYRPLEAQLSLAAPWSALGFDFDGRRKAALIEDDLVYLGWTPGAIEGLPRCKRLPETPDLAAALGAIYVMEGATLGGQLIARHVGSTLGLTSVHGCRFFTSYGKDVGPRWQQFRTFLIGQAGQLDTQKLVAAAENTFQRLEGWLLAVEGGKE